MIGKGCDEEVNEGDGDTGENRLKSVDEQIRHQMYVYTKLLNAHTSFICFLYVPEQCCL